MDIKPGDFLVVSGKSYPIRAVEDWSQVLANSRTFTRLATLSATTKRTKKGEPVNNLSGLSCTPLDPVDAEIRRRLALETPNELLQTFLSDGTGFVRLVIEDLKR